MKQSWRISDARFTRGAASAGNVSRGKRCASRAIEQNWIARIALQRGEETHRGDIMILA